MSASESRKFDVIVAGLGAMGSAALYHLARGGVRALGIDQFSPPHSLGSSHGETRVIREAYFEDPVYVPLVQRAFALWAELERESGESLYLKTGGLMVGREDSAVVAGALRSAREHQLPYELLDPAQIRRRFPAMRPDGDMTGVLEPRAGILYPEKCVGAHLRLAQRLGAIVHADEMVQGWEEDAREVKLRTSVGGYSAGKLILACGPWLPRLLARQNKPGLASRFEVERQVLLWFKARDPSLFAPERFPIHLWEYAPGEMFYGFPDLGTGVKVALHHQGEIVSPDRLDREIREHDLNQVRRLLHRYLPDANGEFLRGTVCLYTNTPDAHFVLDAYPGSERVILASPCSGHGFKFSSAIGEELALRALGGASRFDLHPFAIARLTKGMAEARQE